MTQQQTAPRVVGEDLTASVVIGALSPESGDGEGAGRHLIDHYEDVGIRAALLRSQELEVSVAMVGVGELQPWLEENGGLIFSIAALDDAAKDGVSDDLYPYDGDMAAIARARLLRVQLMRALATFREGTAIEETLSACAGLYRLAVQGVGGYCDAAVVLPEAPGPIPVPLVVREWLGLASRSGSVIVTAPLLTDGRGNATFQFDADRRGLLAAIGLGLVNGGQLLVRSFGDRYAEQGTGALVFGWSLHDGRADELDAGSALLAQFETGAGADDATAFATPSEVASSRYPRRGL